MWKIPLFELNYNEQEALAVQEVLQSQWLTMGAKTNAFETHFTEFLGGQTRSLAVTNCTAALHMSVLLSGIGAGDEVIIPALTFIADANAVSLTGATPVPADCHCPDNWNVTADSIRSRITERTKAVIIVHFAGFPCDMDPIVELCRERQLTLIEDVAHAPGATYKGQACGTLGDFGCFSFFSNKNLSTGEGGMLTINNAEDYEPARLIRSHGMSAQTLSRHEGRAFSYDVVRPGLNYRIDELRSALGLVQLEKLPAAQISRAAIFDRYRERLANTSLTIPFTEGDYHYGTSAYHIMPVLLKTGTDRSAVMSSMKEHRIQTSIHYPSIESFTAYKHLDSFKNPIATDISNRELTLPLYPTMSLDNVDHVCECLLDSL